MSSENLDLDNDEQGERGQIEFEAICIAAKLTCNSAKRDRAGYDFAINDRISYTPAPGLDSRQAPLSCLVQVKTIRSDRDIIKLRLSSAEQIAKDPKPAFIYVFRMNADGTFINSYLIHLLDDNLKRILERLRKEEADGKFAVNHAYIYFTPSLSGMEIEPTGPAFRTALEQCCGADLGAYITNKRDQLDNLGFDGTKYKVSMTLTLSNESEFTDMLLGLKSEIPAKIIDNVESRFGIELKRNDFPRDGELTIQPFPVAPCDILFRRNRYTQPVIFQGLFYQAPRLSDKSKLGAISAKSKLVTVVARIDDEKFSLKIDGAKLTADEPSLTPQEWLSYFRLSLAASTDGFSLEIRPKGMKPLKLSDLNAMISGNDEVVTQDIENTERLIRLMEMAGAPSHLTLNYNELVHQAALIASAYAIMENDVEATPLSFAAKPIPNYNPPASIEGVHANYVQLETALIVWTAKVKFRTEIGADKVEFISNEIDFLEIQSLEAENYADFIKSLRSLTTDGLVVAREAGSSVEEQDDDENS